MTAGPDVRPRRRPASTRPRGRPKKSEELATRDRLLEEAAAACAEVGFDAVTLASIAARAGVTPAAVYNHFADKEELLYTAGRLAIARLNAAITPSGDPAGAAHDVVAAFVDPSFRSSRRLILELHAAGARHPELAGHLADWHREAATFAVAGSRNDATTAMVQAKVLFVLLLGCCHLEDLDALETSPDSLQDALHRLVDAVYGGAA